MFPLPPLSFSGGSSRSGDAGNGGYWALGQGAWNVNLGGSGGPAAQSTGLALSPLLIIAGVATAWFLLKR